MTIDGADDDGVAATRCGRQVGCLWVAEGVPRGQGRSNWLFGLVCDLP